jgi:hypothetical protein
MDGKEKRMKKKPNEEKKEMDFLTHRKRSHGWMDKKIIR